MCLCLCLCRCLCVSGTGDAVALTLCMSVNSFTWVGDPSLRSYCTESRLSYILLKVGRETYLLVSEGYSKYITNVKLCKCFGLYVEHLWGFIYRADCFIKHLRKTGVGVGLLEVYASENDCMSGSSIAADQNIIIFYGI